MKVRITQCGNDRVCYRNLIGKTYNVQDYNELDYKLISQELWINKGDCEIEHDQKFKVGQLVRCIKIINSKPNSLIGRKGIITRVMPLVGSCEKMLIVIKFDNRINVVAMYPDELKIL